MQSFETVIVDSKAVSCNGGGALGHPLIYLNLGPANQVECPYCSKLFVLDTHVAGQADPHGEALGTEPH